MSSDSQYLNPQQQQQDVEDDTALQSSSSLTLIGQLINENYLNEGASDNNNNKNVDMVGSSPPLSTSIVDNTAELNTSLQNTNMIMDEMNDKNTKNTNNNNNNNNNSNGESDDELTNEDGSFVHVTNDYCHSGQPSASSTVGGGSGGANDENDFSFEMEQALATPLSISTISTISDDTMIESNDNNLTAVEASTTTTTDEQQEQQQQQVPTTMAISTTASLSLSSSWNTIDTTTTTTTSPVFTEWEFDFDRDELAALQEQATTPRLETQTQQEEEASEEEEGDSFRPIASDETDKGEESEEAYEKLIESSGAQINEPEQRSLSSDTAVHHEDHVHSLTTIVESKQQQQQKQEEEEKMTRNLHWSTILIPNNPRFNIYANTAVVTALSLFLFTLHSACCSSTQ